MDYYGYGACNEIYVEMFSEAFNGLTFPQAAEYELNFILLNMNFLTMLQPSGHSLNSQKNNIREL